jgi:hypothetical protein
MADIVVGVDPGHIDELPAVVERLRAAGMTVTETLERAGVVTGTAPESQLAVLAQVEGVASVERERGFDVGPPDATIQ